MEWIAAGVVLILIIAGVALPYAIHAKLNRSLRNLKGYAGRVGSLRTRLWRGEVSLYTINVAQVGGGIVLHVPEVTVAFQWRSLVRKKIAATIVLHRPELTIVPAPSAASSPSSPTAVRRVPNLKHMIEDVMAFTIDAEIRDGKVLYTYADAKVTMNVPVTGINVSVSAFSNNPHQATPCLIEARALCFEGAAFAAAELRPMEPALAFDLEAEVKSVNLVFLNDIIRAYGKVDINQGTLDVFSQVAVGGHYFKGYIKPVLTNLDFIGAADRSDSFLHKVWERIVAVMIQAMENNRKDQVATTIPIEGRLDNPDVDVATAVWGILQNAFVQALAPAFDPTLMLQSMWKTARARTRDVIKAVGQKLTGQ